MESLINRAIGWFKDISEATKELTSGNVSHKACAIRGLANGSAEYLEECKGNLSVIKWQTGEPNINGAFLVTYKNSVCKFERKRGFWVYCGLIINDKDVVAWCKLSDIESYKEETK